MTKKRWIVLAGMLAAGGCLTLAVLALLPPRPGVTRANFERIEHGMTLEEVEKILGGEGPDSPVLGPLDMNMKTSGPVTELHWVHPDRTTLVAVDFDGDNRVVRKWYWEESPPTFMQKLKRLLHL
jgi:hypothetical protein